jgi:hypothetical protein
MKRADVTKLNKELTKLSTGRTGLQDFVTLASRLDPRISKALEGIYCGTSGSVHEQIPDTRYWIAFGWYADPKSDNPPKVEYAYIS